MGLLKHEANVVGIVCLFRIFVDRAFKE